MNKSSTNEDIKHIKHKLDMLKIDLEVSFKKLSEGLIEIDLLQIYCREILKITTIHSDDCLYKHCECITRIDHGNNCLAECVCKKMFPYIVSGENNEKENL